MDDQPPPLPLAARRAPERGAAPPDRPPESPAADRVDDEQLWSWVDRDAPELAAYLERHPEDRARVDELRRAIRAVTRDEERTPGRIGPYPIKGRLGSGGMGVVFEAEQVHPRRPVAIKVIRGAWLDDERTRRLFHREAEVLGRLQHPGIATIHDAGETKEGAPYFVMELVVGRPLDEWARGRSLADRLHAVIQVARAVQHAHDKGVIHRDLKPSNVLVNAADEVKVLDFGLARIVDPGAGASLTAAMSGKVIGTVRYMSPEQARGMASKVTPASDVYSIGVLLYELVTGVPPYDFAGADLFECARRVAEDHVPPASAHAADLPRALDDVLAQAMAKRAEERYASAAELAEDLERVLDGEPVRARPRDATGELEAKLGRIGAELGRRVARVTSDVSARAQGAAEAASVSARRAARAAREKHARWKDGRETLQIDLNPALDAVGSVAGKIKGGAAAARSRASGAVKGRLRPKTKLVLVVLALLLLLETGRSIVENGVNPRQFFDEVFDRIGGFMKDVIEVFEDLWRSLT